MSDWTFRFWHRVDQSGGPDACWPWTGARSKWNYGLLSVASRMEGAHRLAWTLFHGPIPDGIWVLHHCDNPPCVNPSHLFLGTHADNMADMAAKGRGGGGAPTHTNPARYPVRVGERNPNAKLTPGQVAEIRTLRTDGVSLRELGRRFGVHNRTIERIVKGDRWTA
jgi:hypothetical protein